MVSINKGQLNIVNFTIEETGGRDNILAKKKNLNHFTHITCYSKIFLSQMQINFDFPHCFWKGVEVLGDFFDCNIYEGLRQEYSKFFFFWQKNCPQSEQNKPSK